MLDSTTAFASDVLAGLAPIHPQSKRIAPKYFYDAYGSALFDRICQLPEYYPTRTELRILSTHASEIASLLGSGVDIIEFGAGSLTKIRLLLNAFASDARPRRFIPIDISGEHLLHAVSALKAEFPDLAVEPVVADYMAIRSLPSPLYRPVGFFPGSTIGNLEIDEARQFLGHAATLLRGGGLLVGVDLVKPPALLHAAYNDREGITAEFNLNLLRRINRELDGNFDLKQFSHYAFYHPARHRIEMHLVSQAAQTGVGDGEDRAVRGRRGDPHGELAQVHGGRVPGPGGGCRLSAIPRVDRSGQAVQRALAESAHPGLARGHVTPAGQAEKVARLSTGTNALLSPKRIRSDSGWRLYRPNRR